MNDISVFVITGGPGAGKTTALNVIPEWLSNIGFNTLVVPETATELLKAGVKRQIKDVDWAIFQEHLLHLQIEKENVYRSLLSKFHKCRKVLLCDRGVMDAKAYLEPGEFERIIKRLGYRITDVRDKRYDAVFHLVTAAEGAEEFYTLNNNDARLETSEEARAKDILIKNAWIGHNHPLTIIDNFHSKDFEHKLKRLWGAICHALGIPEPIEDERRFLIQLPDLQDSGEWVGMSVAQAVPIYIEQMYLVSEGSEERRIRKRGQDGGYVYYITNKRSIAGSTKRIETEKQIQEGEYYIRRDLEADPLFHGIRKTRYCFIWESQYFELDIFIYPHPGLCILEIELTTEQRSVVIPAFIRVMKEITGDTRYSNRELARKGSVLPFI